MSLSRLNAFIDNRRGSTVIVFALSIVPIILAAGMGIDLARAVDMKDKAQRALDSAVLAAATKIDLSQVTAQTTGSNSPNSSQEHFNANFSSAITRLGASVNSVNITPGDGSKITGSAVVKIKTTLLALLLPELTINVQSEVKIGGGARICVLALNPTMDGAIDLSGTADIVAPNCAVYANSASSTAAIRVSGSSTINAGAICAVGNTSGSGFSPTPKTACPAVPDPFPGLIQQVVDSAPPCTTSGWWFGGNATIAAGTMPAGTNVCGTWEVDTNGILNLDPGIYYAQQLKLASGAELRGQDVTIVLYGNNSYLNLQGQAGLQIKAPNSGQLAGIALAQDPRSAYAGTPNTIIGGGNLEPSGMVYLPARELYITGAGSVAATVPQFAVVVDHLVMQGNGQLTVKGGADFQGANLPELPAYSGGQISLTK